MQVGEIISQIINSPLLCIMDLGNSINKFYARPKYRALLYIFTQSLHTVRMGNNYTQQQHTRFINHQHLTHALPSRHHHHASTTSSLHHNQDQGKAVSATLVSQISAKYISRLPQYYSQLYQRLPKSVLLWQIQQIQTWLHVIGMKSHVHAFRDLAIDGSSIYLLDVADLRNEIGIRSEMSLGIFQAWLQVGLKEYEKYRQQKQREIGKIQQNIGNVERIDKMITSVNEILAQKHQKQIQQQQSSCMKPVSSQKVIRAQISDALINTQNKPANIQSNQSNCETQPDQQRSVRIKKLEVLDKQSNICLEVEKFPKGMMEQFENIYREFGIKIGNQDKYNQKQQNDSKQRPHQQSTKNTIHSQKNHPKLSLRRQLRESMLPYERTTQRSSHFLYAKMVEKEYERLVDSLDIVITRTTNTNNINQYRFALMVDPAYDVSASNYILNNTDDGDIFGSKLHDYGYDDTELSILRKKVSMTRRYQQEQQQENTSNYSQQQEKKLQINAYMLLNQPTIIPRQTITTKADQPICRSYSDTIPANKNKNSINFDNDWKFVIENFAFVPQFQKLDKVRAQYRSTDVGMWLNIAGTNTRLKLNPNQYPPHQKQSNSQLYLIFYVVSHRHSRHPEILTPSQISRLAQYWSKQEEYTKMCGIIYVREQAEYYLCQPTQVNSFIANKIKQVDLNKRKTTGLKNRQNQGTNKKQQKKQQQEEEKKMEKSRGLRKKECPEQIKELEKTQQIACKYQSNREQYNNSLPAGGQNRIWVKLPIYPYSNKLTPSNSIKIVKGTTLKLGRRQYIFNINTILLKYVEPSGKPEQGYITKPSKGQAGTNKCILCYERQINCLYLDCRHSVTCLPCGKLLEKCPICRNGINDYLRVYTE